MFNLFTKKPKDQKRKSSLIPVPASGNGKGRAGALKRIMVYIVSILMIIGQIMPVLDVRPVYADTNNVFDQDDWSGGELPNDKASDPGNQTGWTKYSSKSSTVNTQISGRAYVSNTSATKTEDTNTDFGAGTLSGAQIVGTGTSAKIEQIPAVNNPFVSNLKQWGNLELPPRAPYTGAAYVYVSSKGGVYAFFGMNQKIFWMYNLTTKKWEKKADAPKTVEQGACLAYVGSGNYIYAIRGGGYADFWRYDIQNDTWDDVKYNSNVMTLPKPPYDGSSMVVTSSGHILILFGNQNTVAYSYELHRYTIASGVWTRETSTPDWIPPGSLLFYEGTGTIVYYLRGGENAKRFWRYNWQTKLWNNAANGGDPADIPDASFGCYTGSYGFYRSSDNSFYLEFGNSYQVFYKYSLTSNTWTRLNDTTWQTRPGTGLVYDTTNEKAVIFYGTQWRPSTYDFTAEKWDQIQNIPWVQEYGSYGVYYNGEIYFTRGWSGWEFFKYTIATNKWTYIGGLPVSAQWGTALAVNPNNGDIYMTQGGGGGGFYRYRPGVGWTTMTAGPGTYIGADLCYYKAQNNKEYIYELEGYNANVFYCYDIDANTWLAKATTPLTGVGYGGTLCYPGTGDYIYAFRGNYNRNFTMDGYYNADGDRIFWRYSIPDNTWTTLTPCPFIVSYGARLKSDATGTYLYATVGGSSSLFVRYDIAGSNPGTWSILPQITDEHVASSGGLVFDTVNNKIYAWSGGAQQALRRYDVASGIWEDRTAEDLDMQTWPFGDSFWDGLQFVYPGGDTAYLIQGWRSTNIWPYTISTNSWSPMIRAPFGFGWGTRALVVDSDTVYVLEGQRTPYFWKWTPSTNTWTQLADVIDSVTGFKERVGWGSGLVYVPVAGTGGKIYCQVGNDSYLLRSYNIDADTWTSEINSPTYNGHGGFLLYSGSGSYLYSITGRDVTNAYRYDMDGYIWTAMAGGAPLNINYGCSYYYSGTGDHVYIMPRSDTLKFLRFDFSTESFNILKDYPLPGYDGRSAIFAKDDTVYAFFSKNYGGNIKMSQYFNKYSISNDLWQGQRAFPDGFNWACGVYVPKMRAIYVSRGTDQRTFYRYYVDKNIWERMTDAPSSDGQPYEYPVFAYDNSLDSDYIYCARGRGYPDFYRYKISTNAWETLANIPNSCWWPSLCRPKGSQFIYLLRGWSTKTLYRYDTGTNTWSSAMPDAPWDTDQGAAMVYPGSGDYIYVFRGRWTQDFRRFNYKTESWDTTILALPPAAVSPGQGGVVYPGFGDYIYVVRSNNYKDLWRYSVTANTWDILPDCAAEVYGGGIFYGGDGNIYIMRPYDYLGRQTASAPFEKMQIASMGTFTSKVIDVGVNQGWGNMDWVSTTPSQVSLKARASNSLNMSGTYSWQASPCITKNSDLSSYVSTPDASKYIQYYVELFTENLASPASIDNVTINYNYFTSKQELVSSAYNSADSKNRIMKLGWVETQPAGSDIRFQIHTAQDDGNGSPASWGPWVGPGGTQTFNNNFATPEQYAYAPEIEVVSDNAKLKKILQDFAYTQMITIDTTAETRSYTDKTITIEFTAANKDFWNHIKSDGSDMRFTDISGNLLTYNINTNGASFNYTNKYAKVYVKAPSLPVGQKTKIYLKYGKPDAVSLSSSDIGNTETFTSNSFTAYDASAVGGRVCKGYQGVVSDGRYVYFIPYNNGASHGIVLRYDTQGSYTDTNSWASFDAGSIDGYVTKGYTGAVFDGRYVYFVPHYNANYAYHGIVLRYDTQASFSSGTSWQAYDFSTTDGYGCVGYQFGVFDGKYVYFVPYYGSSNYNSVYHGIVVRYDTTAVGGFKDRGSWGAYDASQTQGKYTKGYIGGVFDGRYVYFVPYMNNNYGYHGVFLRYDTQASFFDKNSWSSFDASATDGKVCKGYQGGVFDGRYIYFAPHYNGAIRSGIVLRYDTQADFNTANSWNAYDTTVINTGYRGYMGAVFNGRYVYFVPHYNEYISGTYNGLVLRYDTQANFINSNAWASVDAGGTGSLVCKGYIGAVLVGKYIYFAPYYNATPNYSGIVLRLDASCALSLPYYAYALSQSSTSPSLSGWNKRLVVNIDNSKGGALVNYQVRIPLDKAQADSFWASCKNDGADIRFVNSDNTTLLKYWRESFDYAAKTATLWVKVPSIAEAEIKTIYLYYGRADAADDSSFDNTMTKDFPEKTANISGIALNGVSDKVTVASSTPLNLTSAVTLEAQVKYTPDYWPKDWTYRKKITIDNTAGTRQVDALVQFDVPYQAEMKADYSDLRFWETDHSKKLRYRIKSSDAAKATIWLIVPLLDVANKDIYIYYGNASAVSESDTTVDAVPQTNLIGWWKFDEGAGTSAADSSAIGNNAALSGGVTWTTDRAGTAGRALSFDGSTGYVRKTGISTYNRTSGQELSVGLWMYSLTTGGAYRNIVTSRSASLYNWILYSHVTGGTVQLHGAAQNVSSFVPPLSTWTHVMVTISSSGAYNMYVNGVLNQTFSGYTYNLQVPNELSIGNYGTSEYFSGKLDNVTIYDRALSLAEVNQVMNGTSANIFSPAFASQETEPANIKWLPGFGFRKMITLDNTAGSARTNATAQFDVDYVSGNMKADYSDLRFMDTDGKKLSYRIKSYNGVKATVMVKIPLLPVKNKKDICLYYGNASAASDIDDTIKGDPPQSGLVGWWKFDEGSGTSTADSSPTANSATLGSTATWVDGKSEKAVNFPGNDNGYVSLPAKTAYNFLGGDFTFAFFVKWNAVATYYPAYFEMGYYYSGILLRQDSPTSMLMRLNGPSTTFPFSPVNGTWYHMVIKRESGVIKAFVDGVQIGSSWNNAGSLSPADGGATLIGRARHAGSQDMNGAMDQFVIYSRALSTDEILALKDSGSGLSLAASFNAEEVQPAINQAMIGKSGAYELKFTEDGLTALINGTQKVFTVNYSVGKFMHTAMSYDGANLKLYVDGIEKASTGLTGAINTNSNNVIIGDKIKGAMDEVRIWNIARPGSSINADKQKMLSGNETGLVAYFMCNENTGTTAGNAPLNTNPGLTGALTGAWLARPFAYLNEKPIALYHCDNGTGNSATDSSGYSNTLSLSNMNWDSVDLTGFMGAYGLFSNGTTSFGQAVDSASLDLTGSISLEAWIKPQTTSGTKTIIDKGNDVTNVRNYALYLLGSEVVFSFFDGTAYKTHQSVQSGITALTPYYVVATFNSDTDTVKIYVNGAEKYSNTVLETSDMLTNNLPLLIGKSTSGNYFQGTMDEIRIYNRVLSGDEVYAHYLKRAFAEVPPTGGFSYEPDAVPGVGAYSSNNPVIQPVLGVFYSDKNIADFVEVASNKPAGTEIKYQLSNDGYNWYWYNGSIWTKVTGGYSQSNTASEIYTNLTAFQDLLSAGDFYYRAYLHSADTSFNTPALDNIAISLVTGETYYIDPAGATAINTLHSDATHDQWYQYKAILYSEGKDSPLLDDVQVEYLNAFIAVTAPNGGELLSVGQSTDITWNSQAIAGATNKVKIEYSSDGGSTYNLIANNVANTGTYAWTVPDDPSLNGLIKITSVDFPVVSDVSNAVFKILALIITSPNGAEIWEAGKTHQIRWTSSGAVSGNLTIQYSVDSGNTWVSPPVTTGKANTGTYNWVVPSVSSDTVKVKVFDASNVKITDTSDAVFSIVPSPAISISAPIGLEQWKTGTQHTISWRTNHRQFSDQVKLQYSIDSFTSAAIDIATVSIGTPVGQNNNDDITGSYSWTIPDAVSGNANVRVKENTIPSGRDTQIAIQSTSNTFSIIEPIITVTAPTAESVWTVGDIENITWATEGTISNNLLLEYSVDAGANWVQIATGEANDGTYAWTIPIGAVGDSVLVRITDSNRAQVKGESAAYKILGTATIKVLDPNGAEVLTIGADYEIKWQSWGSKLRSGGADYDAINLYYSSNSGSTWILITDQQANDGSYIWAVPDIETMNAKIKIIDMNDEPIYDISDANFTIAQPTVTITAPNGNETLYATGTYNITWTTHGAVSDALTLEYSTNSGSTWNPIASNEPNDGLYTWTVVNVDSPSTILRITDAGRPVVTDNSDAPFTIKSPTITITSPNGGEELVVGTEAQINWASEGRNEGAIRDNLTIQYTINGTTWLDIAVSESNDGSYLWIVPDSVSATCKVKIFDASRNTTVGVSAANFNITLPYIQVLAPNGGEAWVIGTQHEITWRGVGTISNNLTLEYSKDNFLNSTPIVTGEANDGTYTWTVPDDYNNNVKVRVTDGDRVDVKDASDSAFSIANPTIRVTVPNGGELFTVGDTENITWEVVGALSNDLKIEYSKNNFASAGVSIAAHAPNTSPYSWQVPSDLSATVRIRITDNNRSATFDKSDADFTILPMPVLTLTAPNGGEVWRVGTAKDITWTDNGGKISNNLTIQYSTNGGSTWSSITTGAANTGKYTWTVPDSVSVTCLVKITDASRPTTTVTSAEAFRISDPLITITSPNGNEVWAVGDRAPVSWTTDGAVSDSLVLEFSPDNGGTYYFVATVTNSGLYNWTIPDYITSNALFRIKDANRNATVDVSDHSFIINASPTITVLAPSGGETYVLGDSVNITWEWTGLSISNNIVIDISNDGFITSQNIVRGVANNGAYQWLLSGDTLTGANLKVRITDGNRTTIKDTTDGYFRIRGGFTVTSPNGGEDWGAKSPQTITWSTRGSIQRVKLEYTLDDGTTWAPIIASTANTNSYSWTLPDIKSSTVKVRVSDADDSSVNDSSDAAFHIVYFTVRFSLMDYDTMQHLSDFSVSEPTMEWAESGLTSPITRTNIYPYGTYTTFFTKTNYIDNSATWSPPKSGTATYVVTVYLENSASAQVTWDAILTYSYAPADDSLNAVGSLQRKGKLVGTTELERSDMGPATLTVYEPDGSTIRKALVATAPNASGTYTFTYANTLFEAGKVYPATLAVAYRAGSYISSANIDVGAEKLQYEFFTKSAKQLTESVSVIENAVSSGTTQTQRDIESSRQKMVGDLENTRQEITTDIAASQAALTSVLTSTETALKASVEIVRAKTEAAMKTEILNTESTVKAGDTLIIRYRTYTALKPVIDVYTEKNVLKINKGVMTEIGTTGIYEYSVKFETTWGKGDYTVVCSETTKGTMDALILTVISTDLDAIAGQVSSIVGSTSGISSLKDAAETMNSQFSLIESALSKMGKDLVNQVKEATSSVNAFDSLFSQLSTMSKQLKEMAGESSVNLAKLYDVSAEKKDDMTYLKNKTQELKAAMELSKKMVDNMANKPITQTWYEYK